MYTLDKRKIIITYLLVSIFCIIFSFIYELFSHGVISKYMMIAPLIPAIFGLLLNILIINKNIFNKYSFNLYNSLIAITTIYLYLMGILEIYGTTNKLINIYPILIIIYILLLVISFIYEHKKI